MSLRTRLCRLEARRSPRLCEIVPPWFTLAELAAAWDCTEDEALTEMRKIQAALDQSRRLFGLRRGAHHEAMLVTAACYYANAGVSSALYRMVDAWRECLQAQGIVIAPGGNFG